MRVLRLKEGEKRRTWWNEEEQKKVEQGERKEGGEEVAEKEKVENEDREQKAWSDVITELGLDEHPLETLDDVRRVSEAPNQNKIDETVYVRFGARQVSQVRQTDRQTDKQTNI